MEVELIIFSTFSFHRSWPLEKKFQIFSHVNNKKTHSSLTPWCGAKYPTHLLITYKRKLSSCDRRAMLLKTIFTVSNNFTDSS